MEKSDRRNGFYFINEKPYPSVTTILQAIAKPQLIYWAAKTAARAALANPGLSESEAAGAIYSKRDTAGKLGTTVHSFVEAWKNNHTPDLTGIDAPYIPYAKAFLSFVEKGLFTFLEHEKTVFSSKHGFAGTLDIIAKDKDGNLWVLDVKTSNDVYPEMGLQLAAYKEALEEMTGQPIKKTAIIHLKEDTTFSLVEMDEPFEAFLHVKGLYEWMEADKIEEVKKFSELKPKGASKNEKEGTEKV